MKTFLGLLAPDLAHKVLPLLVLPLFVLTSIKGDTVELKTGERIQGKFKQATVAGAVMEVAGQPITIPLPRVKAIYFGAESPADSGSTRAREALEALQALRSVTGSGIVMRDYAPRVLDARVKLDRYQQNSDARTAMALAMREYELASEVWSASVAPLETGIGVMTGIGNALERNPVISSCPAVRTIIDHADETKDGVDIPGMTLNDRHKQLIAELPWVVRRSTIMGHWVSHEPGVLWTCARAHLAEAERLLSQH